MNRKRQFLDLDVRAHRHLMFYVVVLISYHKNWLRHFPVTRSRATKSELSVCSN